MKKLLLLLSFCFLFVIPGAQGAETWVKVTAAPTDWSGEYLIVYDEVSSDGVGGTNYYVYDGSKTDKGLYASGNYKTVTITDNKIETTDCNYYFTITPYGSSFSLKSASGYYIGRNATTNGMNVSLTMSDGLANTFEYSTGVVIKGKQGVKLQFYSSSGEETFKYYKSTQKSISLYKKQASDPTEVEAVTIDPAFGNIEIGKTITVDCQTKDAVLNGKIGNNVSITNESFPYTYTIQESDLNTTLDCVFEASKEGLTSSKLEGTYKVVAPAAEKPTFSLKDYDEVYIVDEGGNITNEKVVITGTAGCSLSLTVNGTEVETVAASDAVPTIEYTFSGDPCEKFTLVAKTKNKYNGAEETTAHYIIASTSKLMGELTADKTTLSGTSYATFSPAVVAGGVFAGVASKNSGLQFNTNANGKNSETYMTYSIGDIQSVSLTFGGSGAGNILEVYGSNTPYSYDKSVDKSNGTGQLWKKETRGTLIKEITSAAKQTVTFNVPWDYQYIGIRSQAGAIVVASLKVIWRTGVDGLDVSYDKVTEASLVSGKFSVLAAMNGSNTTFARNEGVATVELGDDGNISLLKGQITVDEFEINGNQDSFTLCGGLGEIDAENNTRTYLAVDADNNVIRVQDNASAANFKLELENGQVLVKFDGGEYLAYNGTNFVKTATIGEGYTAVNIFVNGSGVSTGVEAVEIEDADAPVEYYNLQGVRVANPQNGLYIVRQGNKVSKQIIR